MIKTKLIEALNTLEGSNRRRAVIPPRSGVSFEVKFDVPDVAQIHEQIRYDMGVDIRACCFAESFGGANQSLKALRMFLAKEVYGDVFDSIDALQPLLHELRVVSNDSDTHNVVTEIQAELNKLREKLTP